MDAGFGTMQNANTKCYRKLEHYPNRESANVNLYNQKFQPVALWFRYVSSVP